jgi:hypothetical protein
MISLLCPSYRPKDLKRWLDSLYDNCDNSRDIELSLTLEEEYWDDRWGGFQVTYVKHGQYNINQLVNICYTQSTGHYTFLSGDDTICHTKHWDTIFKNELSKYPDDTILLYPNDLIFGKTFACYPVTTRKVMDLVFNDFKRLVPYDRYCIDDTIFDIVPYSRRIYLENVIMEHLHLVDEPPGLPVIRDGKTKYYPHNEEAMGKDRFRYNNLQTERNSIRMELYKQMDNPMKILIAVPTAEMGRRADFYDYFNALDKPVGTMVSSAHGQSPARNRNMMIRLAINNDCTHIFFLDDDLTFQSDSLKRLIAHDKDIVSGLYLMRNYPHMPILFNYIAPDGRCLHYFPKDGESGLMECKSFGLGCVLIKTDVFRSMTEECKKDDWVRLGELERDHWCDDIGLWNRVRSYGWKLHCDLDTQFGHMAQVTIYPAYKDGKWMVEYDTQSKDGRVAFPAARPTPEEVERVMATANG